MSNRVKFFGPIFAALALAVFFTLPAGASVLPCNNSLQNGGFDQGLQFWTSFSDSPGSTFDLAPDVKTHLQNVQVPANARALHISNFGYYAYFGERQTVCTNPHELYRLSGKYESLNLRLNPDPDGNLDAQGRSLIAGANVGITSADTSVTFTVLDHMTPFIAGTVSWQDGLPLYSALVCTGDAHAVNVEARVGTTTNDPRFGQPVGHGAVGQAEFDQVGFVRTGQAC